ncbi:efflux RND transporter periplasmic adaptor subunit [bacterium]|nr:efflux RND transporter periplasmic adaptor subunit [bacterium]MBU1983814.1 efflux RND transporter periplasmic adaptor subunit [bacterium]
MKLKHALRILLAILVVSVGLNIRHALSPHSAEPAAISAAQQLWTCGMHPTVIQDHPGNCPICGMKLTPMNSGGTSAAGSGTVIAVDPGVIQNIGVRTARAERQPISRTVRTNGVVAVDESRQVLVNLKYMGWVEKLYVDKTGEAVRAGQKLFDIYSPDLVTAMQEYLLAYRAPAIAQPNLALDAARRKLLNWDVTEEQISDLEKAGSAPHSLPVYSPASGVVLDKSVIEGGTVMAGTDVYRIADLGRVWVKAQVYEYELPWIAVGQNVLTSLPYDPERKFAGTISYIYPYLDPDTRTVTIRVDVPNPELFLKPDMFVTLDVATRARENALTVPREAVVRSGRRDLVFVALGEGRFEPRQVEIGLEADGQLFEIRSGVSEGETVVASAQFLLDSETQIQEALHKLMAAGGTEADLHAAMGHAGHGDHDVKGDKPSSSVHVAEGATMDEVYSAAKLYWCPMHHDIVSPDSSAACPLCEMPLKEVSHPDLTSLRTSGPHGCVMCPVVVPGEDKDKRCPICEMKLKPIPESHQH